jgi:hypothetical protein
VVAVFDHHGHRFVAHDLHPKGEYFIGEPSASLRDAVTVQALVDADSGAARASDRAFDDDLVHATFLIQIGVFKQ